MSNIGANLCRRPPIVAFMSIAACSTAKMPPIAGPAHDKPVHNVPASITSCAGSAEVKTHRRYGSIVND